MRRSPWLISIPFGGTKSPRKISTGRAESARYTQSWRRENGNSISKQEPSIFHPKGRLRKRSGPTAKSAAELGVCQYSHAMTMTPRLRKFARTAHVIFSMGWLGAVVAYLTLAIAALTSHDVQLSGNQPVVGELTCLDKGGGL